jgi:hypothetical protein
MYEIIKKITGDREMTAQEAALDALGINLIHYSCSLKYIQAKRPEETEHVMKPRKKREGNANKRKLSAFLYDAPVTKYVKSKCEN